MIFTREQLLAIGDLAAGELAEVPFPALLLAHALAERTVELRLRRGHVDKRLFLEEGVPVDCRSNLLHETIGRYLVQQGKLSEAGYQEALQASVARGVLIGEVLVERGAVDSTELFRALQQSLAKKLLDVFSWREGRFETVLQPPATGSSLRVKVPQLVVTGVTRAVPPEVIARWTRALAGEPLALAPDPLFPLSDLRLTGSLPQLVAALDERPRSLAALAADLGLPLEEAGRGLCALGLLGAVGPAALPPAPQAVAASPPAGLPASPVAVAAAPAAAGPAPEPAAGPELVNAVHQAFLAYRRQDAFDLLGLPEDAPLAFVQYQYLDFARRFAPWRFEEGHADQARELFLAGAAAYVELSTAEGREALRFRRQRQREEESRPRPSSYFQIQTDLLDPESQFAKGLAQREAGRLRQAIEQLEFAFDCDPGNALYLAELAWTRLLEGPDRTGEALASLEEAVRLDPQCGLARFYAGEVSRQRREWARAEDHLRRAIRLLAPDRRPLDALRQLATDRRR